ncbi:Trafficking Protein Particle Complex Subunit 11 [Manis pentadactyla]|nr:Trafficking Protein Particle Complex Subunit 11 [Manis pentadactyla]
MVDKGYGEAFLTSVVMGYYAIQFQDYSEARVISKVMMNVTVHARFPVLKVYAYSTITTEFGFNFDVSAKRY